MEIDIHCFTSYLWLKKKCFFENEGMILCIAAVYTKILIELMFKFLIKTHVNVHINASVCIMNIFIWVSWFYYNNILFHYRYMMKTVRHTYVKLNPITNINLIKFVTLWNFYIYNYFILLQNIADMYMSLILKVVKISNKYKVYFLWYDKYWSHR